MSAHIMVIRATLKQPALTATVLIIVFVTMVTLVRVTLAQVIFDNPIMFDFLVLKTKLQ